ncbi:MAG TPA: ABC transporter substrate-binding protein [Actinomycetota bacterium]|nr:ABC transporter substrate-binding protein [Actinomycetota bacterium]
MRKTSLLALVGVLALAASLVIGPAASAQPAGPERATAGTVVFIHDQEPPNLQGPWEGNNLYATSLVINNIWYGCQIRNDKGDFVRRLCTARPRIIDRSPLTIRFTYKTSARWSDGKPVTARDFRATWRVFTNPANNVESRTGWEDIRAVRGTGKTVTVVFKTRYADWESLVSSGPYPAHFIAGKNMNETFVNSIPLSSGPWKFDKWQKGVQIEVVKNPRFNASTRMKLDRVVFRYVIDTNARFQALKANQGQVMEPQPQLQIADFLKDRKFVVDRKIGFAWEHIDIQFGAQGHPALKLRYVRQALITGMNRTQVANALYGTIAPGLKPVNSHMFKPFESTYRENWAVYKFNQGRVISMLKARGCTGGPDRPAANNDKIWTCPNVGKLEFRFGTTTGNQLRALTFEIIQRQLKSVGIQLNARFQVAGTLFGTTLPSRDWDLIMFTWVGSPATPITIKDLYACGGDQNDMQYCNRPFSRILNRVSTTLSASQRAEMLNAAEKRYMVPDVPSIPVYARPVFVIRSAKVSGPVVNPTNEGSPWNANLWAVTR